MKYKVLDLFSGIGGFSLGLERAGMETAAFCEIDPFCQEVLKKHWPNVPIFDDVQNLTKEKLHETGIQRIDIICGGFPCQDISAAGHGVGLKGERSGLWSELCRLIDELQPSYAIIENVSRLRSNGLATVLKDLWQIRYDAEWHCIPASALGASHRRDRVWILAYPTRQRWQGMQKVQSSKSGSGKRMVSKSCGSGTVRTSRTVAGEQGTQTIIQAYIRWAIEKNLFVSHWQTEPQPFPLVDGFSEAVDRFAWKNAVKAYGNAVIPQIPEILGKAVFVREQALAFFKERMGMDITEIYI